MIFCQNKLERFSRISVSDHINMVMTEWVKFLSWSNHLELCSDHLPGQLWQPWGIIMYPIVWVFTLAKLSGHPQLCHSLTFLGHCGDITQMGVFLFVLQLTTPKVAKTRKVLTDCHVSLMMPVSQNWDFKHFWLECWEYLHCTLRVLEYWEYRTLRVHWEYLHYGTRVLTLPKFTAKPSTVT